MIRRYMTLCLLFATITLTAQFGNSVEAQPMQSSLQANTRSAEAIRRMPLLQRPNRPGHFIGNTIRRNARRTRGR